MNADRVYGVGSGGETGNSGRREVGDELIRIRGRGRDVRGIGSGQTGGMEESVEPPGGTVPDEGDEAGKSGGGTPGLGITFREAKILQIKTKEKCSRAASGIA